MSDILSEKEMNIVMTLLTVFKMSKEQLEIYYKMSVDEVILEISNGEFVWFDLTKNQQCFFFQFFWNKTITESMQLIKDVKYSYNYEEVIERMSLFNLTYFSEIAMEN